MASEAFSGYDSAAEERAMPDNVTNELLLETLKAIQAKLSDIASDIVGLKADMRGLKDHMAAFMHSEVAQDGASKLQKVETPEAKRQSGRSTQNPPFGNPELTLRLPLSSPNPA